MFQRIGRGWGMAKASWAVIRLHPKLLLLPVFSGIAFLALIAAIGATVFAGSQSDYVRHLAETVKHDEPLVYAAFVAFYFACTFIIIFFNSALVFCALQSFAGKEPSVRAGLTTAAGRLPQILAWTFVATTVGLLLNALQNFLKDKLGFLGGLLGSIGAVAWSVVTYFVVPVLVVDGVGPIEAVKRSSNILRRTWGEAVGGEGGLSAISFLLMLPIVLVIGLGAAVGRGLNADAATAVVLAGIIVPYILALTVVFSALGTIFRTGAYIYATTGKAPTSMDPRLLQAAFRKKVGATQANGYGDAPTGLPVASSGQAQNVTPTGGILTATFQGASVVVDSARPLLRVGRGRDNDLVVSDRFASSKHARIECRGEQFFLIDQSSNGTYVSVQGMHEMQVAGREIVLHGSGLIGLGRSPATEPEFGIRFAIQMPRSSREPMGNGSRPATSPEYGGFWRRFVAFVIDYVLVSLVLFALLAAAALVVPRIAEAIDLSTFTFEGLTKERTVESKPAVVQSGSREEGKKTQTEKIVESTVAGRWVYLHRVIETETEKKPSPQTILTTKSVKRIRLDPQTREEVHSLSMLYLFWIPLLLYAVIMESSRFQATFGKMVIGIKVTNDDGGKPSILRALARNLLKILSAVFLMIGFLMAAWTRRKQALHDMMARCCVVITSK